MPNATDPDHPYDAAPSAPEAQTRTRVIELEGGINFRDLGGYRAAGGRRVRWRTIFRAGSTHALTARDRTRLAALGIRSIVDFRSLPERQRHPHGLLGWPQTAYCAQEHNFAAGRLRRMAMDPDMDCERMRGAMMKVYARLPFDFAGIYRQLFDRLLNGPLPLVFNCAAGKDRTGVAAALLLTALGVEWNVVMADYSLTAQVMHELIEAFGHAANDATESVDLARLDPAVIAALFGIDAAYLESMRSAVEARCGSIDSYLASELRLDASEIERLRARLLEP